MSLLGHVLEASHHTAQAELGPGETEQKPVNSKYAK